MEEEKTKIQFDAKLLLVTTLLISICSIIYELMISSISSYLQGDSITQFSITIGLYMSAMGVGSYLSKFMKEKLFDKFVFIEISVGILGGFSSFILFLANIYTGIYDFIMYVLILLIGILVGLEIPILTRIIENNQSNVRKNLANIFTFDYIGGLIGSIIFPLILFPKLGFITTTFLVGTINLLAAILIIFRYKKEVENDKSVKWIAIVCFIILFVFLVMGDNIAKKVEEGLYRDDIILSQQTSYQKIVMTKHKDDVRLFLDGNLQFSSTDEYRYHEALVHIPMMYAIPNQPKKVLVLGGGDGLATRELLKYDEVEKIVLVDIDKEMTDLCTNDTQIAKLNENALKNEKVTIINQDAYLFVQENEEKFDVIIIDFPDPNNESLNKLYTNIFYQYIESNMTPNGVMVCQSTSPYYAKKSYWCINKTIQTQFHTVIPYHLQIPTFGEWGFNLAFNGKNERQDLSVTTKYLTNENISALFYFGKDEQIDFETIEVNDIFKPSLITYYNEEVQKW
ncbi:MAG: polyamine aminopropyltransferase [Clostridia bacterium]|nr:polyamine aminopropyltransferase [Clostridia bacterium]